MNSIQFRLKLYEPLHISDGFGMGRYIDKTMARDEDGIPFIPGGTLKGVIRAEFEKLCDILGIWRCPGSCREKTEPEYLCMDMDYLCDSCRIFGSTFTEGKVGFTSARMDLDDCFRKMVSCMSKEKKMHIFGGVRVMNQVDRERGCAEDRHLYSLEQTCQNMVFRGELIVMERLSEVDICLLIASMRMLTRIGGKRRRGLGKCRILFDDNAFSGKSLEQVLNPLESIREKSGRKEIDNENN